jgi:3-isopropylmalate/(R)-2-methylmalate dehydratase large subunit
VLARAAGQSTCSPGDIVECEVDLAVLTDLMFRHDRMEDIVRVRDPKRVAIVLDHAVPAPTQRDAENGKLARLFADAQGVETFFDVGRHGIVHQILAENGLIRPGMVVACGDSHTCAGGAFASASRGLGPADMIQILCTGRTWYEVPPTLRYEFIGQLAWWVSGKDVFLHLAGTYGDATGRAVEFGGEALAGVEMFDRRTIATQCAEIGADFALFPADGVCIDYLTDHGVDVASILPMWGDDDATYERTDTVNLGSVEPMVALPGSVIRNTGSVREVVGTHVDQAFIGSCANGQLTDLQVAADIVRGRQVAARTRFLVTPASQSIYLEASRLGILADLVAAGATVTNPTCGACFGYHMGVVTAGEVCLTSSTRNFPGRMGSADAEIYMASPATVAASAIAGVITDVREWEGRPR